MYVHAGTDGYDEDERNEGEHHDSRDCGVGILTDDAVDENSNAE
jgi:hypothetical protein